MIEVQFQEFSEAEKRQIDETLNSPGFSLLVKSIEGMVDQQSVDLINSLPVGQLSESVVKSLADSGEELSRKKIAVEVIKEIITGKTELKKVFISVL